MSGDYDNNNRGACWPPALEKAYRVTAEIEHRQFHGALTRTGASTPRAPSHNLWLRAEDNRNEVYCVPIFRSTKDGPKLAGGEFMLRSGAGYYVSLFRNKSEHPKSPEIDLSFQAKEATGEEAEPPPEDDLPF